MKPVMGWLHVPTAGDVIFGRGVTLDAGTARLWRQTGARLRRVRIEPVSAMRRVSKPGLCTHDDPSWCGEACKAKRRATKRRKGAK